MKKKFYISIIVILTVLTIIPFNALAYTKTPCYAEPDSFDVVLEEAYAVVKAELIDVKHTEINGSMPTGYGTFRITGFIKGNIEEQELELLIVDEKVYENELTYNSINIYQIGKEYILILERFQSVYLGDEYELSTMYQMSIEGNLITGIYQYGDVHEDLELANIDELYDKFEEYGIETCENGEIRGAPYTNFTNPKEIVQFSPVIFTGKVTSGLESMVPEITGEERETNLYYVTPTKVLKGELTEIKCLILFTEDIVEGEEYLFLLSTDSYYDNAQEIEYTEYFLSSRNSTIPVSDKELYDEYMQHIVKNYKVNKFFQSIKDWFK